MSKWSSETTIKFIQEYRAHECLWNFNLAAYKDKRRRDAALVEMAETMDLPDFGVAEVKNKIKNLRSTYNQEKKKVAESKKSGKNSVYKSNVKWLVDLEPIMNIEDNRKTFDNFNDEEDGLITAVDEEDASELITSLVTTAYCVEATPAPLAPTPSTSPPPKKKTKSLLNFVKDLKDLHEAINTEQDCFEAFGKSVASQLRNLSEERGLLAQKAIQNILSDFGIEDIRERRRDALSS